MRKSIIALAMAGALVSVAQADVTVGGSTGYRLQSTTVGTAPQTSADRYKLELNLNAKVNDSVTAVAGLRTGPVNSSYTDFGNNAASDTIGINLAYVDWKVSDAIKVTVGKQNQPWADSSSYLFDRDVKPTGFAASYSNKLGVFANVSELSLVEGNSAADARVQAVQLGYGKTVLGVALKGAVGQYKYANVGSPYTVNQVFVTASKKVAGLPVSAFYETLNNSDASATAKAAGVKIGGASAPKTWEVSYAHQTNEANSQYGLWNDSDFAGGQGNYDGNAISAAYVVSKGFKVAAKSFDSNRGTPRAAFKRTQFDLTYSF